MLSFQLLALAGLVAGLFGIYLRYADTKRRSLPADRSPVKGNNSHGITYAFTKGMMPWAKESTRIHMIAYLRGIGFHIGFFAAIGTVILSPFWGWLPTLLSRTLFWVLVLGAFLGAAGGVMRIVEHQSETHKAIGRIHSVFPELKLNANLFLYSSITGRWIEAYSKKNYRSLLLN